MPWSRPWENQCSELMRGGGAGGGKVSLQILNSYGLTAVLCLWTQHLANTHDCFVQTQFYSDSQSQCEWLRPVVAHSWPHWCCCASALKHHAPLSPFKLMLLPCPPETLLSLQFYLKEDVKKSANKFSSPYFTPKLTCISFPLWQGKQHFSLREKKTTKNHNKQTNKQYPFPIFPLLSKRFQ